MRALGQVAAVLLKRHSSLGLILRLWAAIVLMLVAYATGCIFLLLEPLP